MAAPACWLPIVTYITCVTIREDAADVVCWRKAAERSNSCSVPRGATRCACAHAPSPMWRPHGDRIYTLRVSKRVLRTSSWSGLATFVRDCCGGVGAMLRVLGRYSVQCVETHTLFAEAAAGNISAQRRGYGASRCTGAKLPPEAKTWCTCGCVN